MGWFAVSGDRSVWDVTVGSSRVTWRKLCEVPDDAVDDEPAIVGGAVLLELLGVDQRHLDGGGGRWWMRLVMFSTIRIRI
jgi:hypothetical protein